MVQPVGTMLCSLSASVAIVYTKKMQCVAAGSLAAAFTGFTRSTTLTKFGRGGRVGS